MYREKVKSLQEVQLDDVARAARAGVYVAVTATFAHAASHADERASVALSTKDRRHLALAGCDRIRYPPLPFALLFHALFLTRSLARSTSPPVTDAVQFADDLLEFAFSKNDQKGSSTLHVKRLVWKRLGVHILCLSLSLAGSEGGMFSHNLKNIGSALKDLETMRSTLVLSQPRLTACGASETHVPVNLWTCTSSHVVCVCDCRWNSSRAS
jgi:hypothetical protein